MNYFFIICILIMFACFIAGTHRGMLKIIYGIIAWVFVFWFVNFANPYVLEALNEHTNIEVVINEKITERLELKYEESEKEEEGSGKMAVYNIIPLTLRESFNEIVKDSVDKFIETVASAFTDLAMKGVAAVLSIILAYLIIWLIGKILILVNFMPGLNQVNRLLGGITGLLEGLLIIWIIMFVADMFPTSLIGQVVVENVSSNEILLTIYDNNFIKLLL